MQTVIIVVHLMIVLAMVGLVLLQKSEGGGLGMGGGGNFMSNRGASNVMTRATAILAALFFATSLILSILAGYSRNPRSLLDSAGRPASSDPAVPGAPPASGSPGGLIDQLRGGGAQPAPAAPAAPSGPQVPRSQ